MFTRVRNERTTLLQGKPDLLISRTPVFPSDNGLVYAIGRVVGPMNVEA